MILLSDIENMVFCRFMYYSQPQGNDTNNYREGNSTRQSNNKTLSCFLFFMVSHIVTDI